MTERERLIDLLWQPGTLEEYADRILASGPWGIPEEMSEEVRDLMMELDEYGEHADRAYARLRAALMAAPPDPDTERR